jgi:hypothetical protein
MPATVGATAATFVLDVKDSLLDNCHLDVQKLDNFMGGATSPRRESTPRLVTK